MCRRPAVNGAPCLWHDPARKPQGRRWPLPRRWRLMELVERGWDDGRIAAELGTTAAAVHLAIKRYRIPSLQRTCFTAGRIARLLGIGCAKTVVRWIEAGWLRGRRGWQQGPNRVWIVAETDLHAFLADPQHFHRYDPERITDRGLRDWAREHRKGGRFLTHAEAQAWLREHRGIYVVRGSIKNWLDKGQLPFVRNGRGNRLIRESDLRAFQLPRLGKPKAAWPSCAECGDPDGPIRSPGVTPHRVSGERFGISGQLCATCYRRRYLAARRRRGAPVPIDRRASLRCRMTAGLLRCEREPEQQAA